MSLMTRSKADQNHETHESHEKNWLVLVLSDLVQICVNLRNLRTFPPLERMKMNY